MFAITIAFYIFLLNLRNYIIVSISIAPHRKIETINMFLAEFAAMLFSYLEYIESLRIER